MFRNILSVFFLIAAVVIFFTWTKPLMQEADVLKSKRDSYEKNLADLNDLQDIKEKILSQYNSISQENLDRMDKMLPSGANSIEAILEVEKIVKNAGMSLKTIDAVNPSSEKSSGNSKKEKANSIPVNMKLSGSYSSFVAFLGLLEKNLRLVDVEKINFSSGTVDVYEYNITAKTYWVK